MGALMTSWPVQDAKARFSEMLETCLKEGAQIVTKRGADAAVLVPMQEWQRLKRSAKPTYTWLKSPPSSIKCLSRASI